MISCSFSSLTRKVALGSNSVTTPGNSSTSSLAILTPGEDYRVRHRASGGHKIWRNLLQITRFVNHRKPRVPNGCARGAEGCRASRDRRTEQRRDCLPPTKGRGRSTLPPRRLQGPSWRRHLGRRRRG